MSLHTWDLIDALGIEGYVIGKYPVRSDNNVQQIKYIGSMNYHIGIDRRLDHHFLVYVEYQLLQVPEEGGVVSRGRQLVAIPKGKTLIAGGTIPPVDDGPYDKISVRVLPYKEMEEIELPYEVDNYRVQDNDFRGYARDDFTVIAGHKFRPYRIASSSFFILEKIPTESDW